jgi:hypothetical protein
MNYVIILKNGFGFLLLLTYRKIWISNLDLVLNVVFICLDF